MKPPKDEGNTENPICKIYHIDSRDEKTHVLDGDLITTNGKKNELTKANAKSNVIKLELRTAEAALHASKASGEDKEKAEKELASVKSAHNRAKIMLRIAIAQDKQKKADVITLKAKAKESESKLKPQQLTYSDEREISAYIDQLNEKPLPTNQRLRVDPQLWWHTILYKKSFKVLSTIENFESLIKYYGISIRYNEITKDMDVSIPKIKYSIDNSANASMSLLKSIAKINNLEAGDIPEYMLLVADKNRYNPVTNWIKSRPWDGISRIDDLLNTIQAKDEEVKQVLIKRWLINCIANVFDLKPKGNAGVLVFQGGQGLGKTKWFKRLAPDWIKDGITLSAGNKDSVLGIIKHWIVELGELDATFRKSDVSNLKSFITADSDSIRRPYARTESYYPRRTAFFGSVNDENFLIDETGNRRYWTIGTTHINHNHTIDMQQLWAEVYESKYLAGEEQWLNDYEFKLMMKANEEFEVVDPIEDGVRSRFDFEGYENRPRLFITGRQILNEIGINEPNRAQSMKLANILKKLKVGTKKGKQGKLYSMPQKNRPKSHY
jgi:putative DNA primase/helicase